MNWFDEQIRQRVTVDDQLFSDVLHEAADTVLGKQHAYMQDDRVLTADTLEKILRYYHLKYQKVPETITDLEDQMEYILHPQGMMYRRIKLDGNWYNDAIGAFLGFRQEDGSPVALIPSFPFGYRCYDPSAGETYWITRKSMKKIREDAYCFYHPFPQTKLSIPMLFRYIVDCLHFSDIALIVSVTLLTTLVANILPDLTSLLFGVVLDSGKISVLSAMAVFMICVRLSSIVISAGSNLISGCVQTRLQLNIESAAMMRVLSLPPEFFREYNSGELSSRMQSVNSLCSSLVSAVLSSGLTSLVSLLYVTKIFQYARVLVVPSLLIIFATLGFSTLNMILETVRQKKIMEVEAKTLGLSFALVNGIQKIRLAGAEKRMFAHWARSFNQGASLRYNPPLLLKVNGVITEGIRLVGTIILYSIALNSAVSMSDYMAFNQAYGMVMGAFASLVSVVMVFARIKPVLDMARPILVTVPETGERKKVLTSLKGNIEINNVTFRYVKDGPKIIDNLSLKIHAGEYVAIVGPSGCGKSTLVRLLLGFEKPELGAIFYDGKNLNQIDLKSLRRKIGTVMQSSGLFNNSIYENIALSASSLTMDEAWEAAETACIADDIRAMPMGMHTMISEGQGGISGGQKQRLMIARAIAPKPSILIFDEATSALDNIAQKKITQSLDALHCTRLVIAHRLSTIRSCNRILYIDGGKVQEEGTYEELMKMNGLFADMVARQQL
ncbi:MAG: ATP-binding cassette domain-containing protein [Blautia sp.]|nr:ATP-binding cassette domain-containing protein [Blautia sp.]